MTYLLLTDETNQQPSEAARFFIYGGVFFPLDVLPRLHDLVADARDRGGYRREDEFKFDTRSRPPGVSRQDQTNAKRIVLNGCAELGVRFVAYLALHDVARTRSVEQTVRWGANTVLMAFQRFLEQEDAAGVCVVDRLPFKKGHKALEEMFQLGLDFNGRRRILDRVHLFAETTQGESFVASAVDVVLGSFRYCVNDRRNERATRAMLPAIVDMMWSKRVGETIYLREYGLLFRPKVVRVAAYEAEYQELTDHFSRVLAVR